jgi:L-ribulose-5-phosphate 4-epimerase
MQDKFRDLKEWAFEANLELPRRGLAIGTFGNASEIDRAEGVFAIKPSGVPFDALSADDMVVVDLEGVVVEGNLRPSTDTRTHLVLYRNMASLGGIVHTHSMYATGWAQAGRNIPIYGTTHADHLQVDVPCTAVMSAEACERDYETETGNQILECFRSRDPSQVPMVLVAGHGAFAWGESAERAVYNAQVLEAIASMAFVTHAIDPAAKRLPEHLVRKHFERKHGASATYGQRDHGVGGDPT